MITFIRPCIFLVLFSFFALMFGKAMNNRKENKSESILKTAIPIYAGITVAFMLSAFPSNIQHFFMYQRNILTKIAATVIILTGLGYMGTLKWPQIKISPVVAKFRVVGYLIIGFSLGIAWTHCLTPILGLILTPISINPALVSGTLILLLVYSAGLAVPLMISALLIQKIVNLFKLDEVKLAVTINGSIITLIGAALFTNYLWVRLTQILILFSSNSLSNHLEDLLIQMVKK